MNGDAKEVLMKVVDRNTLIPLGLVIGGLWLVFAAASDRSELHTAVEQNTKFRESMGPAVTRLVSDVGWIKGHLARRDGAEKRDGLGEQP